MRVTAPYVSQVCFLKDAMVDDLEEIGTSACADAAIAEVPRATTDNVAQADTIALSNVYIDPRTGKKSSITKARVDLLMIPQATLSGFVFSDSLPLANDEASLPVYNVLDCYDVLC